MTRSRLYILVVLGLALVSAGVWGLLDDASTEAELTGLEAGGEEFAGARRDLVEHEQGAGEPDGEVAPEVVAGTAPVGPIGGRVVDESGRAVEGAVVLAWPANSAVLRPFTPPASDSGSGAVRTETDVDGRFELDVGAGVVLAAVSASKPHLAPAPAVEVLVGRRDVELVLPAGVTLRGRVHDLEGAPVAAAELAYRSIVGGAIVERRVASDAGGRYELPGIPVTDRWALGIDCELLEVRAEGFAARVVADPLGPMRELVRTGVVDLDVLMTRGGVVRGRVVDGVSGVAVSGIAVELWSSEGRGAWSFDSDEQIIRPPFERLLETRTTDPTGSFSFQRVPASYDGMLVSHADSASPLTLRVERDGSAVACRAVDIRREGDEAEIELRLFPAGRLRGRIVDQSGAPIGGAMVTFLVDGFTDCGVEPTTAYLGHDPPDAAMVGWTEGDHSGRFWQLTGPDGVFDYALVPCRAARATPVELEIEGRDMGHVVLDAGVEAGRITDLGDISVEREASVTYRGRVVAADGDAVPGAVVWIGETRVLADAAGIFPITVPGSLEETGFQIVIRAPGHAILVTETPAVEPGGVVDYVLSREHRLGGIVVDADGRPVEDADVAVVPGAGEEGEWGLDAVTGEDGRFIVEGLPAPPWRVECVSNNGGSGVLREVSEETDALVLTLPGVEAERGGLIVRVLDETGSAPLLPMGAELGRFGGHRRAAGEFEWREIPVGVRRLRVMALDRATVARDVTISAGAVQTMTVTLEHGVDVIVRPRTEGFSVGLAAWQVSARTSSDVQYEDGLMTHDVVLRNVASGACLFSAATTADLFVEPLGKELLAGSDQVTVELVVRPGTKLLVRLPVEVDGSDEPWVEAGRYDVVVRAGGRTLPAAHTLGAGSLRLDGGVMTAHRVIPTGAVEVELTRDGVGVWRRRVLAVRGRVVMLP